MERRTLIGNVRVRKPTVYVGEPLAVKVVTLDETCDEAITATINGVPGKSQYLQFKYPGRKKIHVAASTRSKKNELRTVEVDVLPRPDDCDGRSLFPVIGVSQNFHLENGATLRLDNPEDFSDKDVYFVWEVGEGVTLPTAGPVLNYSFEDRLEHNAPYTAFDIMLHVKTRNNQEVYSGRRTVTCWNNYYLNKRRGFIQLKVEPEFYARREGKDFVGRFTIRNLEPDQVRFTSVQIDYLYNDPEKMSTPDQPKKYDLDIGPKEIVEHEFAVPTKGFPRDAFGFALHFRGQTTKELLALADVYFEIRTNPRTMKEIADPEFIGVLDDLRSRGAFLDPGVIPLDRLQEHLDARSDCCKSFNHRSIRERVEADWLNEKLVGSIGDVYGIAQPLKGNPDGDLEGHECTPEDEDNPRDDLICQLTDEWRWVIVPARILNARKGDAILSPGGQWTDRWIA